MTLTQDIINQTGSCINFNASNVVFDCSGHGIGGNWAFDLGEYGIKLQGNNNVIKNCAIWNFYYGIWLNSSNSNTITQNNIQWSGYSGLLLGNSINNKIELNNIENNVYGFGILNSDNTVANSNRVCSNLNDFWLENSAGSAGINNTCFNTHNWNDSGTTGCANPCACVVPADNMRIDKNTKLCPGNYALPDSGDKGVLIIGNPKITLDCNSASITGSKSGIGIYNVGYDDVKIINCNVSQYSGGIELENLKNNNLTDNVLTSNSAYGIYLRYVNNSYLYNNTAKYGNDGIILFNSNNNQLYWNIACANHERDIKNYFNSLANIGERNKCNTTENWNDQGASGCAYTCQICKDWDVDGVCDDVDNCRFTSNPNQNDVDGDGVGDVCDNCINVKNPDQSDYLDLDGIGDACDNCWSSQNKDQKDTDYDCNQLKSNASYFNITENRWLKDPHCGDACDNCPSVSNPDQNNSDGDFYGDACDNCWYAYNQFQEDKDGDCSLLISNSSYWYGNKWLKDPHCGDACDNCVNASNPYQENKDGDKWGDKCDNCPATDYPSQSDSDKDGVGDACDNCWDVANPDQKNWNNDKYGDACDCWDGFKGPDEVGADCGGICVKACPACIPIIKNGPTSDKIDVVFVPDKDYGGNMTKFLDNVMSLIQQGYLKASEINDSRCKFNFYYYPNNGSYVPVCQQWNLPASFSNDCGFYDTAAIIFTDKGKRACSSGKTISTDFDDLVTVVHESGHNIFGMNDEYCCDGTYGQLATFPHIFSSLANCQALSSNSSGCFEYCPTIRCWPNTAAEIQNCKNWFNNSFWPWMNATDCNCTEFAKAFGMNPSDCKPIASSNCPVVWQQYYTGRGVLNTNSLTVQSPNWCFYRGTGPVKCCGNGWWKSDPDSCYMVSGNVFGPDCHNRTMNKLNSLPACTNPGASSLGAAKASLVEEPETSKIVILDYNIKNNKIVLLGARIVYNTPPNYFLEQGKFNVIETSATGQQLMSAVLSDPREFRIAHVENFMQGMMMGDDVNFTVILPLLDNLKTVEIRDFNTNELVHSADLSGIITDFYKANNYVEPQRQISYLDKSKSELTIIAVAALVVIAVILVYAKLRGRKGKKP